jgi:beta-glucosidase
MSQHSKLNHTIVESWLTHERDARSMEWFNSSRYKQEDRQLEKQPDLEMTLPDDDIMTTITIKADQVYQEITGIGTSMEESTVHNLLKMSAENRDQLLAHMLDPVSGIGISQLRITIGSSDFTAQPFYTYNDLPQGQTDESLSQFSIQKDIDLGIISILQTIKQIRPDITFFASPWSPPGWMKTSGSMVKGAVKDEYLSVLARYYVKFIKAYQEQGIPISAITLQNEPLLEIGYPSTLMPWDQEAALAKLLRNELDEHQLQHVGIWIFDHNPAETMVYPAMILQDTVHGAYDAVDGTAFHDYDGDLELMSKLRDMFPEKHIYMTERAVWGTEGSDRITQYFRNWARCYISWVLMLDSEINTHQWVGTPDPTPIIQNELNPNEYWKTPEYYFIGHYSKFVSPGYSRIESNYGSADTITNVAFMDRDQKTIVAVVTNQTDQRQAFKIWVDGLQIKTELPAKCVATYKWNRHAAL